MRYQKFFMLSGLVFLPLDCYSARMYDQTEQINQYNGLQIEAKYQIWASILQYCNYAHNSNNLLFASHIKQVLMEESYYDQDFSLLNCVPELSYANAIERIEWAYRCSHLGHVDKIGAIEAKHQLIFKSYPEQFESQMLYPVFKDKASDGVIFAPINRYDDCKAGQYEVIEYRKVKRSSACEVRRYQALHEGLITELEYEDLKAKHKAPQNLDNLRPVTCDE